MDERTPQTETSLTREERRSAERRLVRRARAVADRLLAIHPVDREALPLHEAVLRTLDEHDRIATKATKARARLRDRLLREVRQTNLDELEAAVGLGESARTAKDEAMLELEAWRERFVDEGDAAIDALLIAYPHAEPRRQRLRQLARQARKDGGKGRAYKALFAALREISEV